MYELILFNLKYINQLSFNLIGNDNVVNIKRCGFNCDEAHLSLYLNVEKKLLIILNIILNLEILDPNTFKYIILLS